MENRYKMMMICGAQMVSMLYLIEMEYAASVAVMVIALVAVCSQTSRKSFSFSSVVMILLSMAMAEGFLMLQPMGKEWIWHLMIVLNGIFAFGVHGCLNAMSSKDRVYLRWVMDWLLAFSFLLAGVLFLMPDSLRMYLMEPLYLNASHTATAVLLPMILCLPYYPLRIMLKGIRTVKCSVYATSESLLDPEILKCRKLTRGNFVK